MQFTRICVFQNDCIKAVTLAGDCTISWHLALFRHASVLKFLRKIKQRSLHI